MLLLHETKNGKWEKKFVAQTNVTMEMTPRQSMDIFVAHRETESVNEKKVSSTTTQTSECINNINVKNANKILILKWEFTS